MALRADSPSGTGSTLTTSTVRFQVGKFSGSAASTFVGSGSFKVCRITTFEECPITIPYSAGASTTGWVSMTLPSPFYDGRARYYARRVVGTGFDPANETGVVQIDLVPTSANRPPVISNLAASFNGGNIEASYTISDPDSDTVRDLQLVLSRLPTFPSTGLCTVSPTILSGNNQTELAGGKSFRVTQTACPGLIGTPGAIYYKGRGADRFLALAETPTQTLVDPGNQQPAVTNVVATVNADRSLTVSSTVNDAEGNNFRIVGTISNPAGAAGITFDGRSATDRCSPADCSSRTLSNGSHSITWPAADVARFIEAGRSYRVRVQAIDTASGSAASSGVSGAVTVDAVSVGGTTVSGLVPRSARLDIPTTFTVTGAGLVDGMVFTLNACEGIREESGGTATQRQFTCTPRLPGTQAVRILKAAAGANLFPTHVRVEHPVRIGDPEARGLPAVGGVSLFNGNFHMSVVDLAVPGKGLSFALGRSYNSYDWVYEVERGAVGRTAPWRFSTDLRAGYVAGTAEQRLYLQRPDGSGENFRRVGQAWRAVDIGNFSVLRQAADGSLTHITRSGLISTYENPAQLGRLLTQRDRDGNTLTYRYDGTTGRLSSVADASARVYQFTYDASGRISRVTDFTGRFVEYTYTAPTGGRIQTVRDVRGNLTRYAYNAEGFLETVTDPRGNVALTLSYANVYGNTGVQAVTTAVERAAAGRSCGALTTFTYCYNFQQAADGSGFTTTVDGPENLAIARVNFDNAGRATAIIDGQGNPSTTKYNDPADGERYALAGLATERRTPRGVREGFATQFELDLDDGLTLASTNPLNQRRSMTWVRDAANNRYQVDTSTSPMRNTTGFGYSATGRLERMVAPVQQASNGPATQFGWSSGVLASVTDPLGNRIAMGRDTHGNLTSVSDPRNSAWLTTYEYDALGRPTRVTDARGGITLTQYDAAGNVTEVRRRATGLTDLVTTNTYDANGNLTSTTDPRGNTVTWVYDAGNRVTEVRRVVSGQTVRQTFGYDGASRLVSITNENGNTGFRDYDANSRLVMERKPLLRTVRYTYDEDGRVRTRTDGENRTTTYEYDALGRTTAVIDPANNATRYSYDDDGRVSRMTDALGRVTEYGYDGNGNLRTVKDPMGVVSSADYDAANRMTSRTDPRGQTTRFGYDAAGNMTSMTDPLGNTWTYGFDQVGNQVTATTPDGRTTAYTYDGFNRLIRTVSTSPAGSAQVTYTWDGNGNLTQMVDSIGTTTYQYDEANRLTALTDPFGVSLAYTYDAAGNRRTITYPGNRLVTYGYDAAERMVTVTDWTNRTARYTYNLADQITRLQHGNGTTADYGYDAITGRLASLVNRRPAGEVISSHQHTYDATGSVTEANEVLPLEPTLTPRRRAWVVDAANRVINETVTGSSLEHDSAGRLIRQVVEGQSTVFTYNERDLLTAMTGPGRTETYRYNGHGHRLERAVNGATTRYLVEPNGIMPNVLAELNGSNSPQRLYLLGATGLLAQIDASGVYRAYHSAPIGHVVALTNGEGQVSDSYAYSLYGETFDSGFTINPFRFGGNLGVIDDMSGLKYMRARYYNSYSNRFVSADAVMGQTSRPGIWNRYSYANSNPTSFVDPTGYFGEYFMSDMIAAAEDATSGQEQYNRDVEATYGAFNPLRYTSKFVGYAYFGTAFALESITVTVGNLAGASTAAIATATNWGGVQGFAGGLDGMYAEWQVNRDMTHRQQQCALFALDVITLYKAADNLVSAESLGKLKKLKGNLLTKKFDVEIGKRGTIKVTGLGKRGKALVHNTKVVAPEVGPVGKDAVIAAWDTITDSEIFKSCQQALSR